MQVSIFATMLAWMVLVGSVLAVFVGMYGVNNETKNVQTEAVAESDAEKPSHKSPTELQDVNELQDVEPVELQDVKPDEIAAPVVEPLEVDEPMPREEP